MEEQIWILSVGIEKQQTNKLLRFFFMSCFLSLWLSALRSSNPANNKKSRSINMIYWQCKSFSELTTNEVYKILQLRSEIFVVEQNCAYQDIDNKDLEAFHFMGWEGDSLIAYARLLRPGNSYTEAASIGRVCVTASSRRKNLGKLLMQRSIEETYHLFGNIHIKISAQLYLKRFYESFSFVQLGPVYLEDGIEHIMMKK